MRNAVAPSGERHPPEIFCCGFTMRMSLSARLFVNGTRKSVAKRRTSAEKISSRRGNAPGAPSAGRPRLPVRGGGGFSRCPSATRVL